VPRGYLPPLDGLRGIAVGLVLLHNLINVAVPPYTFVVRVYDDLTRSGWIGVQLFFALSGFLITGILLDSRGKVNALRSFWARRAVRIFPLYYATLFVVLVILPHFGIDQTELGGNRGDIFYWLYISNWVAPLNIGTAMLGHAWSLCVEEQFYLVWPWLVRFVRPRAMLVLCGALVIAAPISRVLVRRIPGWGELGPYALTSSRMDALALGAAVAIVVRDAALFARVRKWLAPTTIAAIAGCVVIAGLSSGWERDAPIVQSVGQSVLALLCAQIVLYGALSARSGNRIDRVLTPRPLLFLGKYSYGIYMIHVPVLQVARRYFLPIVNSGSAAHRMATLLAYEAGVVAVTIGLALLSWNLLEKRMLALKKYFPEPGERNAKAPPTAS
jgi:peptidoglycan/LPS O-acetylase OafA/YrhL